MRSLKDTVVTGFLWLAATKALGQAINWVITIWVIRLLAPQDYGLMGMATLVMGFMLLFNELGLGAAIVQRRELSERQVSDLATAIFMMNAVLFILLFLCAPLVAGYFHEPRLINITRVVSLNFIVSGLGIPSAQMLARRMAFKKMSQAEVAGNVLGGVSMLLLALRGFGVWSLVGGYIVQALVVNGTYRVYCPVPIGRTLSLNSIRGYMNFGFQVAASRILWYISSSADFMVVGRLLGSVQLGYYNLAFQLASLPIDKGVSIVTQVAFPLFSSQQHDNAALRRHFLKLIGLIALVTCPVFLGLFAVADTAVRVCLTSKWVPVILPLQLLCLVSWLRAVVSLNSQLVIAKGRPRIVLTNFFAHAVVMPVCFYIGARYGLVGVSMAWILAWPFLGALITWQTLRLIELPMGAYLAALKHPLAGAALMVVAVRTAERYVITATPSLLNLVALSIVGALVYIGYMLAFNRSAIGELRSMIQSARSGPRAVPVQALPGAAAATVEVAGSAGGIG